MAKMIGRTHGVGPGGKRCACCYVHPRHYGKMNRIAKKRERREWKKEVQG